MTDVDLSFNETLKWIFSGLNVKILQCNVDPICIVVQSENQSNQTEHMVENPEIIIRNSSFSSLDLKPESKALITDCYIDGKFQPRPTLITANNSDVSIQNCHFGNFINENGSTVLYGHDSSNVRTENSVFIRHNSSKGVLFMQNYSSIHITGSSISQNVACSPGYSSITLKDNIDADVNNTVFRNNSALMGGALIAEKHCKVALTNCTFSSNRAKTLNIPKTLNGEMAARAIDKNNVGTYFFINSSLFNHKSSHDKNLKLIAPHQAPLVKGSTLNKTVSKKQEDPFLSVGGSVYVAIQSQLFATNCVFKGNSAEYHAGAIAATENVTLEIQQTYFMCNSALMLGGAIHAGDNVTLNVQETVFVGNKAFSDGGAIHIQHLAYFGMKNCVFDENISERLGGAIGAGSNATLDIQETNFTHNRAEQGGAIDVDKQSLLRITNCTFKDNHAQLGGALFGGFDSVFEIIESQFIKNGASRQGGAINVQENASLLIANSRLERNFAETDTGGGIVVTFNVKSKILETNFTGNSAPSTAGALMIYSQTECHVEWCVFSSNTANMFGGAVGISLTSSLIIENTNFTNNNSTDGGAIAVDSNSKLQTKTCIFLKNFAKQTGGAIILQDGATGKIESCHFLGNHAENGGVVYFNAAHQIYLRATFFLRNVASNSGGAITINQANNAIINNITCVGNRSPRGGCLCISSVVLTLNNSDISQNFGYEIGTGILADYSRMQVGYGILNEGKSTLWNVISSI